MFPNSLGPDQTSVSDPDPVCLILASFILNHHNNNCLTLILPIKYGLLNGSPAMSFKVLQSR